MSCVCCFELGCDPGLEVGRPLREDYEWASARQRGTMLVISTPISITNLLGCCCLRTGAGRGLPQSSSFPFHCLGFGRHFPGPSIAPSGFDVTRPSEIALIANLPAYVHVQASIISTSGLGAGLYSSYWRRLRQNCFQTLPNDLPRHRLRTSYGHKQIQ